MRFAIPSLRYLLVLAVLGLVTPARAEEPKKPAAPKPAGEVPLKPAEAPPAAKKPEATKPEMVTPDEDAWPDVLGDPRAGEVPLPAFGGWDGYLVLDNQGVGIWTVKSWSVFPRLACPEIVGIDDHGRCLVLTCYSGKWAALETVRDGTWLGGLVYGDGDPRIDGDELYTGSQRGNLYQVLAHPNGTLENRRIGLVEGRSVNTLVLGDVDATTPGNELIIFTWPGGLFRADPTGPGGTFVIEKLADVAGRVRDAVILPAVAGRPREIATVSRNGKLEILSFTPQGPRWETVYQAPMGMGRIALKPSAAGEPVVLYSTHDDGRILRHERGLHFRWRTETIYLGPQGPRGIATGRFFADHRIEAVAIYGYSKKIELLSREPGKPWTVETIFKDPDKGHWLAVAEVDGRNATDELIASGFGGRIVLLARPPGYGRGELTVKGEDGK